jgi:hypothetical protein
MKGRSEWSNVAARWHEPLRTVVAGQRGTTMRTLAINELIARIPGVGNNAQFVQPSDHCVNITNEGACWCTETDSAIFKQLRRGVYLIR